MSERNDGGQAFPLLSKWDDSRLNGMTLRDYFAAKAMEAIVEGSINGGTSAANVAKASYIIADAMLKAREGKV